jgi:hypothetical protein
MASRIASPPVTEPGADSGAKPPSLMGQSAAFTVDTADKPPKQIAMALKIFGTDILFILIFLSLFGWNSLEFKFVQLFLTNFLSLHTVSFL